MNHFPQGPGWRISPAKMSKWAPEWHHAERRLTVTVYAARPSVFVGMSGTPASVAVSTDKPELTEADAETVRVAFDLGDAPVRWTPDGKGRYCTISEVRP